MDLEKGVQLVNVDDIIPNRFQPREVFDENAFTKYMDENPDLKEKYYKVSYELKKKELTDDVKKDGLEIPGFHLIQNKNIQIN